MVDVSNENLRYQLQTSNFMFQKNFDQVKISSCRSLKLTSRNDFNSILTYFHLAICEDVQRNYHQAIRRYRSILHSDPTDYLAYSERGSSLLNLGKFDDAIEKFRKILEFKPEYTDAHMRIVLALLLKKKDEEALRYFDDIKVKDSFRNDPRMSNRYEKELDEIDKEILEAGDKEVLLLQERKRCMKRLMAFILETKDY